MMFPKPRKRAKAGGEKRKYAELRVQFLRQYVTCVVCEVARASEVHHRRGRQGRMLNDTAYWSPVCGECHRKIHGNPAWAYEEGWLVRRLSGG